ncbi:MAG: fatty acyl-AMP ligase, partial [Micromonosporaceae bacterium]
AELTDVLVAANDAPGFGDPEQWRPVPVDRTTTAFLQYTSGSTGDPKGVVVSHDNILYNLAAVTAEASWSASMRMGGWLPVYHDMGILGVFLCPILNGGTSVMLTPMSFIRKPVRWLQAIQRYDINVSFAPSFAYDLCVRKVSDADVAELDLSGWHLAGNASEPVNPATIAAFVEKFGPAGFRPETFAPIYGLAELTAYVCGHRGRPARITTVDLEQLAQGRFVADPDQGTPGEVVSCGPPTRACEIRVVDPASRQVLPEGQLGEVWLRGRSVASGYWKHPATAQVFGVSTADREAGFLRTGDLGVMYDGELYLHGRIKDTLIVNGRNIYPHDVEHELREQHPELGNFGAVFAGAQLPHAGDGPLVVAHEVGRVEQGRLPSLATEMRLTVGREFGVPVAAVVLLRAGSVLRTTSGKIRRSAMREQFCSGAMKVLYSDRPVSAAVGASPDATP